VGGVQMAVPAAAGVMRDCPDRIAMHPPVPALRKHQELVATI
jgi:hypothetical protein